MVMVGHSERLATPLTRRQSRTMAVVIGIVLALIVAAVTFATVSPGQHSAPGCVDVIVPSSMGAGQLHRCGADARQWCQSLVGSREQIARLALPDCRRAGYTTAGPAPKR